MTTSKLIIWNSFNKKLLFLLRVALKPRNTLKKIRKGLESKSAWWKKFDSGVRHTQQIFHYPFSIRVAKSAHYPKIARAKSGLTERKV